MKLQISFATVRPVAQYAKLCNQFLQHPHVKAIKADQDGYALEAEGEQHELEALADLVAATFPLSCWLTGTETKAIDTFSGDAVTLEVKPTPIAFCQHCHSNIDQDCKHCGAPADGRVDIEALLEQLLTHGSVAYQTRYGERRLRLLDSLERDHQSLMFCDARRLNESLYIDNGGVLLLSSQEKPQLRLQPRPEFAEQHNLQRPLYYCHLADDRISLALADKLAERSISCVGSESSHQPLVVVQWEQGPVAIQGDLELKPVPVHQPKRNKALVGDYEARFDDGFAYLTKTALNAPVAPTQAAEFALEAMQQQRRFSDRTAVLYLSRNHQSGLLYKNSKGEREWLVRLPYQDQNPADILLGVAESSDTGKRLLERFQAQYGDLVAQLTSNNHRRVRGNLSGIMAMVAWLVEIDQGVDSELAAESLLAHGLGHEKMVAPRIDYKLGQDEQGLVLNFLPAIQACMSYRLANPEVANGIAFGVIDSFADFVANWVEQLDADIGLDGLVLAGDEFQNPLLLQQIRLRLGRNIDLKLPQPLDIAGNNIALGALYLDIAS